MRRMLFGVALLVPFLSGTLPAQEQPSLAEQAAAARGKAPATALDPQIAGQVVNGEYRNAFFGFEIRPPAGWETLNRGQMNVDEAVGRDLIGLKAGLDPYTANRVFGMHDGSGASVFVAIEPLPPGQGSGDLESKIEQVFRSQLPEVRFQRESVLLGDSRHRFGGLRLAYTFRNVAIAQSLEYLPQGQDPSRYLISLVVTAATPEKLAAILHDLQSRMVWTSPAAGH